MRLIDQLFEAIWGPGGGLTQRELGRLSSHHPFSKYLPWVSYDESNHCFHNHDETVGFLWECRPLAFSNQSVVETLEGLFRLAFPQDTVIQFILHGDDDTEDLLQSYQSTRRLEKPIVQSSSEAVCDFLRSGTGGLRENGGIPVRNFRLLVSVKMPQESSVNRRELYNSVFEILRGSHLSPNILSATDLLDWSRRFFNEHHLSNRFSYDERLPLSKQVIFSETGIEKSLSQLKVGKRFFRCITPKILPKSGVDLLKINQLFGGIEGLKSDSNQIKTPFLYCLNVVISNLKTSLHTKANVILKQQAGLSSLVRSLGRKKEEYLWATDELEKWGEGRFVRVIPIFWCWSEDERQLHESIARIKRMWEAQGFITQQDRMILMPLFLGSLPFGLYTSGENLSHLSRDFVLPTDTASCMAPVQSDFSGCGQPIVPFLGRKGQLCFLDLFAKGANNYNAFVVASSGSGKSFFTNYLVYNYLASGAWVRIIDIGYSYRKLSKIFDGKFLDFGKQSHLCLNPFGCILSGDEDDFQGSISVIAAILMQMAYSTSGKVDLDETEFNLLKKAATWAFKSFGKQAGVDEVFDYLNTFPKHSAEFCDRKDPATRDLSKVAHTLAFNLTNFTTQGIYGHLFNGEASIDIGEDPFVVLELEELKSKEDLFSVVMLIVVNLVTSDLYLSDKSTPRMIIFDEAWQFLSGGSLLSKVIEEGYRRARKYKGSFTIITQSILDLKSFGSVGSVIQNNAAFKFFLESGDIAQASEQNLIEYEGFSLDLLKSLKMNKPNYSEVFADTPFGAGVMRLCVDPFSYFLATSDPDETAELEAWVTSGLSYEKAIEMMMDKYRPSKERAL